MRRLFRDREFVVVDDEDSFGIAVFGEMAPEEAVELVYLFTEEFWSIDVDWSMREVSEGWGRVEFDELVPISPDETNARPYMLVDLT